MQGGILGGWGGRAGMWGGRQGGQYMFHWDTAVFEDRVHRSLVPGDGREGGIGAAGGVDSRGCSSAITPRWPRLAAHQSGVRPSSSGLLGQMSSRASSVFTTPSCPFAAAEQRGVWP